MVSDLSLIHIFRDAANYIVNLGKEAESKALNEAQANIEEQEKLGAIKIANQIKERETKVAETRKDQDIAIAETKKLQEISVANADKDRISPVSYTHLSGLYTIVHRIVPEG